MTLTKKLSLEEKRKLLLVLTERKTRGLEIPKIEEYSSVTSDWGIGENGYFVRNDGKIYEPSEQQENFISSNAIFDAFFGARGSGKTAAGAQKALKKIKEGKSGAVINPDFENFKFSTWPELRLWIPWNMVVPRQRYREHESWEATRPFTMVFVNGKRMYCKGLKDPESARGPNINWLWYDEARRDKTGLGWKLAIAGVRVGKETQRWVTTSPASLEHWLYIFFVKKEVPTEVLDILNALQQKENRPLIETFWGSIEQNKKNLDPVFYASLIAAYPSGYLRKQEIEGQFANEEGAIGSRLWFDGKILPAAPDWRKKVVRFWDLAGSEKKIGTDPDETVGSLVSRDETKTKFCIEKQVGGFWLWADIKENIKQTAFQDGPLVPIYVEQEPAAGGKNQVAEIKEFLKPFGFSVHGWLPKDAGDRVMAANTWFAEAAQGNWYLVRGLWNDKFLSQLDVFPEGGHDDRITSVSGARHILAPIRKWSKMKFLAVGQPIKKIEDEKKGETEKTGGHFYIR